MYSIHISEPGGGGGGGTEVGPHCMSGYHRDNNYKRNGKEEWLILPYKGSGL